MDSTLVVLIALAVLFALLVFRVPVAFSLLVSGAVGLMLLEGFSYTDTTLGRLPFQTPARYVLIVIPLFIAMGVFAKHGTLVEDAFEVTKPLLRKLPGGLALVTLATCSGFAAICGSSVATVAAVGPIAIREMRKEGYQTAFAAGVVASAGTLGVMIPPSIALVLFGIVSGESIGLLLIAGIVPGLLTAAAFAVGIVVRVLLNPEVGGRTSTRAVQQATREAVPAGAPPSGGSSHTPEPADDPGHGEVAPKGLLLRLLSLSRIGLLFVAVMGGIYSGLMTASQAAALGALFALVFLLWDARREEGGMWAVVSGALSEAISLTTMVFALLIGSAIFTLFFVVAGVPARFAAWAVDLQLAPWVVVAVILLALIPLGMFLDPISMLLVAVPLTYPVVTELGFEGIWFGILMVKMVEVALITPPVGLNPYVVAGSAEGVDVSQAFRGVGYFFAVDLVTIAVLFAFPGLTMWLPNLSGST